MYLTHFGLQEPPFRITPHPAFFYAGANRGATLDALLYAVTSGEGIVKVVGEVGSGKTMLCRMLIDRLGGRVDIVYLANPSYARDEILFAIADELQLDIAGLRQGAVMRLLQDNLIERYANNRQVVVLIDEAHAMPPESLEEIRLLSNLESGHHKLLQLVLFGQPELDATLAQNSMRQLRERIVHAFELEPLRRADVGQYLQFRLRAAGYKGPENFAPAAVRLLADASEGLTRRINILADKALLAAFADNTYQIEARHVQRAIDDSQFGSRHPVWRKAAWLLASALGCLALGWLGGMWMASRHPAAPVPAPVSSASKAVPDSRYVVQAPAAKVSPPVLETKASAASGLKDEQWISQVDAAHFTIQLLLAPASKPAALDEFVEQAARLVPRDQLHVYRAVRQGTGYVGVVYGEFADRRAASQALAALPAPLQVNRPIFRTFAGIRKEIQSP